MAYSGNFEETVELTLGGTKTAGTVEVVGRNLGMYMNDGVSGDIVPFKIRGRLDVIDKTTSETWVAGDSLYWIPGTSKFSNVPNGLPAVGIAAAAALSAATTGSVLIGEEVNYGGGGETFEVPVDLLAASVDQWAFVAQRACKLVGVKEIHSVVGGASAAVRPRKITAAATDAPGAVASATVLELTTANIDLTAAINVTQTPTLTATIADRSLAAGDKVGLDFSGTLTGLVGKLTMQFQYI